MVSFQGKVAFVAGAGGGIGLQIAQDLIEQGAHVSLVDIKPEPERISEGPGASRYFQGDVTEESFVRKSIADTVAAWGRFDYLVNTTGVLWFGRDKSIADMDLTVWDRVLEINLKSFVLTSRYAIAEMKKTGGGAMVHFASIDALRGDDRPQDAYGCAKAAIIRLSRSIAIQFARDGIRSNAVLPGPVHTAMQARWDNNPQALRDMADHVPLARIGTTADMANACLFLLSDKAAFVTGTELIVDGGITAKP